MLISRREDGQERSWEWKLAGDPCTGFQRSCVKRCSPVASGGTGTDKCMLNPGCHTQHVRDGDERIGTDNTRPSRWRLHTLHRACTASPVAHQSVGLKVSVVYNEEAGVGAATDITGNLLSSICVSEKLPSSAPPRLAVTQQSL